MMTLLIKALMIIQIMPQIDNTSLGSLIQAFALPIMFLIIGSIALFGIKNISQNNYKAK